jgi:hypothetical protein
MLHVARGSLKCRISDARLILLYTDVHVHTYICDSHANIHDAHVYVYMYVCVCVYIYII